MKRGIVRKKPKSCSPSAKIFRGLAIILLCCLLVKAISETADVPSDKISPAGSFLTYAETLKNYSNMSPPVLLLASQSSFLRKNMDLTQNETPEAETSQSSPKGTLYYHSQEKSSEIAVKDFASVNKTYKKESYSTDSTKIKIKNNTDAEIDVEALLSEKPDIKISEDSPTILIIHTHASEAYTPDGKDIYTESDPYRTEDRRYNVVALGDILTSELNSRGINVVHDRGIYDYPSYAGSYNRTYEVICSYLEKYPSISMVIDLHRDASEVDGSLNYKTTAKIGSTTASQVMLVVGSNASGLEHPNWKENLRFAVHLQASLENRYPGLARPISISQYRYNQNATTGSLILEIGYCGNTLEEARNAVSYFADAAADVILDLK